MPKKQKPKQSKAAYYHQQRLRAEETGDQAMVNRIYSKIGRKAPNVNADLVNQGLLAAIPAAATMGMAGRAGVAAAPGVMNAIRGMMRGPAPSAGPAQVMRPQLPGGMMRPAPPGGGGMPMLPGGRPPMAEAPFALPGPRPQRAPTGGRSTTSRASSAKPRTTPKAAPKKTTKPAARKTSKPATKKKS